VLNAVMFAEWRTSNVELLDNRLWSQHWTYWDSIIDWRDGEFVNVSAEDWRSIPSIAAGLRNSGGASIATCVQQQLAAILSVRLVFEDVVVWSLQRLERRSLPVSAASQPSPDRRSSPLFPQIASLDPSARDRWNALTDPMIDRLTSGIPRALSLGGGSLSEIIDLVAANPPIRRFVEIGGYEGGSILSLALRFLNRDIDFYSVESFLGNLDGTVDGYPLPSRQRFVNNLARFPTLRATLVPADSGNAASLFSDAGLNFVFIDGCHATAAVLRDIECWSRKLGPGGFSPEMTMAGKLFAARSMLGFRRSTLPARAAFGGCGCNP